MTVRRARRRRQKLGFLPFFLGAVALGLIMVPAQVLVHAGMGGEAVASLALWHGHEMIFGYALAVMGGYLLTKPAPAVLWGVFGAWLLARLAGPVAAVAGLSVPPWLSLVAALLYPLCLFLLAGLPFLRAVRRWRSAMPGLLVGALAGAELLYQLGLIGVLEDGEHVGLVLGIDLVTLMLFMMGGRVTAAASSGALQNTGLHLHGLAQSRWETAGLLLLLALTGIETLELWDPLAGILAILAALVVARRLVGWRFWRVLDGMDISGLHAGYGFLFLGLLVKGAGLLTGAAGFETQHGLLVGALGMLSVVIMGRTAAQRGRRRLDLPVAGRIAAALMLAAGLARLAAMAGPLREDLLVVSAGFWCAALLALGVSLMGSGEFSR